MIQSLEETRVEIAGTCVLIRLKSAELMNRIRTDYGLFLSDSEPSLILDINLTDEKYINDSSWAGLTISDNEINIYDNYLDSSVDFAKGRGSARLSMAGSSIGLSTLLRNIFTLKLLFQEEAIALHAAGIYKEGKVYIFIGKSGSGKSTVSELSKGATVLSDDLVIIKLKDSTYSVYPTPCWLDMQSGERENRQYPIGGIFKLVQDSETYVKKIPLSRAIAEVFTVPHIPAEFQPTQKLFDMYEGIINKFGLYELHFTKDGSFWSHINGSEK